VLIARLTAQLRCYVPEPVHETWGRLRHLGARREQLVIEMVSQIQQIRALLECVWPAALDTARQPFRSKTWAAAMTVVCERDRGDLARTRRLGIDRFEQAVRREIIRRGGQKPSLRILRQLFTALADLTGVTAHRPGALERVAFLLQDWHSAADKLADTEARMTDVVHELKLTELATSIPGLSAVGAAAILAETGDPNRFATARALVKHAGLAPREKLSGTFVGRTKLTGQGRPALRLAAWRGLGRATWQRRLRRPLQAPDHPGDEQAHRDPGPDRDRRSDPATAARPHHHRPGMEPRDRRPRHLPPTAGGIGRLSPIAAFKLTVGASPARH
jgi:transposase